MTGYEACARAHDVFESRCIRVHRMTELATLPSLPRQGAASGKDLAAAYIDGGNSNASDDRQQIEVTEPRPGLAPGSRPRTGRRRT